MAAAPGSDSVIRNLITARKEVVKLISNAKDERCDWDSLDKFFKDFRTFKISAEYSSSCYGPCENAIQLLKDIQTLKLAQRAIEFGIDKDALEAAKNEMDNAMVGKYKEDEDKVLDHEYLDLSTMAFGMIERRIDGTDMKQRALAWDAITGYLIKKLDLKQFLTKKGVTSDNYIVQELIAKGKKAKSGYYNELEGLFDDSFDYRYHDIHSAHSLPFDDHSHYQPRISGEYNGVSDSGSSLLIGGVIGASSIVIVMLIFCLGLAFGMVIYWGYSQKRALDVKRKKVEMRNWINDDEDRNEV